MRAPRHGGFGLVAVEGTVVQPLRLEEYHRIIVLDRRDQQALGIVWIRGHHDFEAAHMSEYSLRTLRMRLTAANTAAARRPNGDRREKIAGTAVADAGQFAANLVKARIDVVRELNLGDRPQSIHAHADGARHDAALGNGCVEHTMLAILALQSFGGAEHAAEIADVLAHQHNRRVP